MKKTIRLACDLCDRDDFDGISRAELQQAIKDGWTGIERVQSYRESCRTYADPSKEPPGFSVFEWWTHLGLCPECSQDEKSTQNPSSEPKKLPIN